MKKNCEWGAEVTEFFLGEGDAHCSREVWGQQPKFQKCGGFLAILLRPKIVLIHTVEVLRAIGTSRLQQTG